ncbi:hypothetical protein SEA_DANIELLEIGNACE_99 [Arthrobacter phage DanielleIgnace]|nr:hypothetical protein SEA_DANIELLEIGNACE_99 [Arthrobacter phage DanielleIgnace]
MAQYEVRLENHPEYKTVTVEADSHAEASRIAAAENEDFYVVHVKEAQK